MLRMPDRGSDTALSRALQELQEALQTCAEVTRETHAPGQVTLWVEPRNQRARSIWLSCMEDEVIVEAGERGGRWELSGSPGDVAFLVDLVHSVMAGRIRETVGPRRSMVEVTLADGSTVRETGYASLVPRPGWKRRATVVQYEAYTA